MAANRPKKSLKLDGRERHAERDKNNELFT